MVAVDGVAEVVDVGVLAVVAGVVSDEELLLPHPAPRTPKDVTATAAIPIAARRVDFMKWLSW
ncbi:MAG: hypothetical protein H6531_01440 [Actinobacteria bacterium]|nr:hypothetical protein [Thermoleophilia bacterium]MCB9010474.1 hypothetical protein [Actinomycetota bacterium]